MFLLSLLFACSLLLHAQENKVQGVGFKTLVIYDSSRNFNSNNKPFEPRPIIAFVWYPATTGNSSRFMLFKNIVTHPSLSAFGPQVPSNEERRFKQITETYPFRGERNTDTIFHAVMNSMTLSAENASPSKGKHPVILFGNGMNAAGYLYYRQCEWLAQHGYVAIVVASKFQYRDSLPTFDQEGINAQWQDMYRAIEVLGKENFVDASRTGIAAWSAGGVSTAILQNKLPQVKAFLSLDAGITYEYGKELLTASPHFNSVSNILLYELRGAILNQVPRSRYYFDSLTTAKRCMLTISGLDHYHFTSVANLLQQLTLNDKKKQESFTFISNLMVVFFDLAVKKKKNAGSVLESLIKDPAMVTQKECR